MKIGDLVADFELLDQHSQPRKLSELLEGGPLVLFFYPMASTGGCTKEACHFRNLKHEFAALGASIAGISRDLPAKQLIFEQNNHFDFPLLSDPDGTVATQFGVKRHLLAMTLPNKRATFVIDSSRRLLFEVASETNMDIHADAALLALQNAK